MTARHFIGACGIQKVTRKGSEFCAIAIALVIKGHGIPACSRIQTKTHVRHSTRIAMAFFVNPGLIVVAHHVDIDTLALDLGDGVVLNGEANGVSHIPLESQVDIAGRHDQCAVDAACSRKGQSQATWPMRDHARLGTETPHAAYHRRFQLNVQIGARFAGHVHVLRRPQFLHGIAHHAL